MTGPVVWILIHDLERTGVPIALERMLRWHGGQRRCQVHVVAGRDGPLLRLLASSAASVTALAPPLGRDRTGAAAAALHGLGRPGLAATVRQRAARHRVRHLPDPSIVLVHGAGAWSTWTALRSRIPRRARLVVHLHELRAGLDRSIPVPARRELLATADLVLGVCQGSVDLAIAAGATASTTAVLPGVTDLVVPTVGPPAPVSEVLGIGSAGWRKGTDRFLAVAHELGRTRADVRCTWIGSPPGPGWSFAVGARLPVRWEPPTGDPWSVGSHARLLLVPSREDPLPLVVLEAGGRGIPVVAARTGGLDDLLGDERGVVVDGHDLRAMADAVRSVVEDPATATERAERLRHHIARHHVAEVVGPRWLDALLGP